MIMCRCVGNLIFISEKQVFNLVIIDYKYD